MPASSPIGQITSHLHNLLSQSQLNHAAEFFIHQSLKILGLLSLMIFIIGWLRTYLPQDNLRRFLSQHSVLGYLAAALFGAITPFCSCSSIPIFIGFLQAHVPLGIAFTFLVTSPIINEYLVVLMIANFGLWITVTYVLAGLLIGISSGIILHRACLENELDPSLYTSCSPTDTPSHYTHLSQRLHRAMNDVINILHKLWLWILIGVGIGALIHNYIPEETLQNWIGIARPFDVPLATLLGIPLYGSCAAIVPVATVLFQKGVPLGTALAFMMAISALSLPEAIMLRRVMTLRLILRFFAIVTLAIILVGYLINFLSSQL
ncbi:MAG: permease [Methylacidiphilales bacterium]|nr:permease [Candidatus Methylacidiphilales bacterium]MDW8349867.1 permease [Verrucomicrobiae bacterium]